LRTGAAATVREALVVLAAHIAAAQCRSAALADVLRTAAAAGDIQLQELWRAAEQQRRTGAGMMMAILASKGPLRPGLHEDQAADVLALYMAPEHYLWLVRERRWPERRYAAWLRTTLTDLVLGPDQ
jgi:hypothetical protein